MIPLRRIALFAALASAPFTAFADKGDEDAAMFNSLNDRDRPVAQAATNGWWKEAEKTREARIAWWREARFGMFIHWGVYSEAGGVWNGKPFGGYAEHLMRVKRISRADYLKLAAKFDPEKFDADAWVAAAKAAGMGYVVITAKHHDGFAMYDSTVSDFNVVKKTPFKRDPVAELGAACHRQGLKFGVYYSHAFDWEYPTAPGNDWEFKNPGGDRNLFGGRNWFDAHPEKLPGAVKYVDEKAIPQIRELLTRYPIDILWFDTPHKLPFSENLRILKAIRETKPDVVVNGRLARTGDFNFGDYANTADRPAHFFPVTGDWEAIPTTNESYGYSKGDRSHKPVSFFVRLLADAVSRNGNLLLNIGPKGDGTFDAPDTAILNGVAGWMKANAESIRGCGPAPLPRQNWGVITAGHGTIYLHVFDRPADGKLHVGGLDASGVASSRIPGSSGDPLPVSDDVAGCVVTLPEATTSSPDVVVAVTLKSGYKLPGTSSEVRIAPNVAGTRLLAFDATPVGGKFGYEDGKAGSYAVTGWTNTAQSLVWNVRTTEAADYAVFLRYSRSGKGRGAFVADGEKSLGFNADDAPGDRLLGTVGLAPGRHRLELRALETDGGFITPNEIRLVRKQK